jgi:hypothetical protein
MDVKAPHKREHSGNYEEIPPHLPESPAKNVPARAEPRRRRRRARVVWRFEWRRSLAMALNLAAWAAIFVAVTRCTS